MIIPTQKHTQPEETRVLIGLRCEGHITPLNCRCGRNINPMELQSCLYIAVNSSQKLGNFLNCVILENVLNSVN